jgi:hypothetical protein
MIRVFSGFCALSLIFSEDVLEVRPSRGGDVSYDAKQMSLQECEENKDLQIFLSAVHASVREKMLSIPAEELEQLKALFNYLFLQHGFAYTLFGDKPMSYDIILCESEGLFQASKHQFSLWKKFADLFPSKNYFFLFCGSDQERNNKFEITLINKKAFNEVFENNRKKFIEVFGKNITAEKLLNLMIEKKSPWNTPMKDRDDLMGMLFGYGKVNAELYYRREELEKIQGVYKKNIKSLQMVMKNIKTAPSSEYASVEEELHDIEERLSVCHRDNAQLKVMALPRFAADHAHPETVVLINKYKKQRMNIIRQYSHRCVLEATLEKLCSDDD